MAYSLPLFNCICCSTRWLTGPDLLAKFKGAWRCFPKVDLVRRAGYSQHQEGWQERLEFTAFYEALLESQGRSALVVGGGKAIGKGWSQFELHRQNFQFNGKLLVGKGFTRPVTQARLMSLNSKLGKSRSGLSPLALANSGEGRS